ncbi:hypothetical protein [Halomarina litorea]|nr:hypothetical protein [Halomarina sp. BCD28]
MVTLSEPITVVALTWLCILGYAGLMYYWTAVPQYERHVRTRT